jgi:hypothetical protein
VYHCWYGDFSKEGANKILILVVSTIKTKTIIGRKLHPGYIRVACSLEKDLASHKG